MKDLYLNCLDATGEFVPCVIDWLIGWLSVCVHPSIASSSSLPASRVQTLWLT
jgi:hypothetical protein